MGHVLKKQAMGGRTSFRVLLIIKRGSCDLPILPIFFADPYQLWTGELIGFGDDSFLRTGPIPAIGGLDSHPRA